jgi:hypothetical protein
MSSRYFDDVPADPVSEQRKRGSIAYPAAYKQLITFEGLELLRGITPTDIDASYDYGGRVFVFGEVKYSVNERPKIINGQKMHLEHQVRSHEKAGNPSVAVLAYHGVSAEREPDVQVPLSQLPVTIVYCKTEYGVSYPPGFEAKHWAHKEIDATTGHVFPNASFQQRKDFAWRPYFMYDFIREYCEREAIDAISMRSYWPERWNDESATRFTFRDFQLAYEGYLIKSGVRL